MTNSIEPVMSLSSQKLHSAASFNKVFFMSFRGKLIEYIDRGRNLCAFVLEDSGKKFKLLSQTGKEISLTGSRIVLASEEYHRVDHPRQALADSLIQTDNTRKDMMASVNLHDIWELAIEEGEDEFAPRFLAELIFGEKATDDHVAALLRSVFLNKIYFKYKEGKLIVHSAEVVEQLQRQQEEAAKLESLLENGARALSALAEGKEPENWPGKENCLSLIRDYYLFGSDAPESAAARELLKKARLTGPHDPFHLLVQAGWWSRNENIAVLRHQIPREFPEEVMDISFPETKLEALLADGRKDLTSLSLLTIDGEDTRDYDDALHIEQKGANFLVGIHIADAASFVLPGTPLFEEARKRITSIYFADEKIPMLPPELSEGECSLILGRDRAALSFMALLSPDGEVLDYDIVRSAVRVKRQLNYQEVDREIAQDKELKSLFELSEKLRAKRIENGALLLPVPDVSITVDPDENVSVALLDVTASGRSLVAEFMVLACSLGARYIAERETPGLFRSQAEPRRRIVFGYEKELIPLLRQRRHLSPAKLLTSPGPHSCVGVMQYTTVTSPIRRFLDLVMQHQISSLLRVRQGVFSDSELQDFSRDIITTQSRVNLVRQLRHRYWLLKHLELKTGSKVDAYVLEKGPRKIHVVLKDTLLEGSLPRNNAFNLEIGDIIQVRIARAVPLDDLLRLEW